MEFTNKEVKRAIRDFNRVSGDMLNADFRLFPSRLNTFIEFIQNNKVLNFIIKPLIDMELDFDKINVKYGSFRMGLNLPTDFDKQLAFVLQTLLKVYNGEFDFLFYLRRIYSGKEYYDDLINTWNSQVLYSCLQNLSNKLDDLIEDEVEGNDLVNAASLQIFKIEGDVTVGNGSNIAVGSSITQTSTSNDISKDIIEQAIKNKIFNAENDKEKIKELENICKKLQLELSSNTPSGSKLKEFANGIFKLGGKALLQIANTVINNPSFANGAIALLCSI